jgi:hypothetical protein
MSPQPTHVISTVSCHLDRRERSLNPSPNSHQPALTTRSISGRRFLHSNFLLSRFLPLVEMTASHHPHYHPDHVLSGRPRFVLPTAICPVDRALPSRPRFVLPATLRPPGRALSSRPKGEISPTSNRILPTYGSRSLPSVEMTSSYRTNTQLAATRSDPNTQHIKFSQPALGKRSPPLSSFSIHFPGASYQYAYDKFTKTLSSCILSDGCQ